MTLLKGPIALLVPMVLIQVMFYRGILRERERGRERERERERERVGGIMCISMFYSEDTRADEMFRRDAKPILFLVFSRVRNLIIQS